MFSFLNFFIVNLTELDVLTLIINIQLPLFWCTSSALNVTQVGVRPGAQNGTRVPGTWAVIIALLQP